MPIPLSADDFKLYRGVCEVRYEDAYLIFDRTGIVFQRVRESFTNVEVMNASPNGSTFNSAEGRFGLEVAQSRFTADKPDHSLEGFSTHCKKYFDIVTDCFEIQVFKRIGLRTFARKDFESVELAETALSSIGLLNVEVKQRFGAADKPNEIIIRWEGKDIGALFRLKAETGRIDLVLPPELEMPEAEIHKRITGLVIDVDFYTIKPVEKAQWDPISWIPQSIRTVRREVNAILSR